MAKQYITERRLLIGSDTYTREFKGFKPPNLKPKLKDDEFGMKRVIGHEVGEGEVMVNGPFASTISAKGYLDSYRETVKVHIVKKNESGELENHLYKMIGLISMEEEAQPDDGDSADWKLTFHPTIYSHSINGKVVRFADTRKRIFDYGKGDAHATSRTLSEQDDGININFVPGTLDISASTTLNVNGNNIGVNV